jgi:hypothetical protein
MSGRLDWRWWHRFELSVMKLRASLQQSFRGRTSRSTRYRTLSRWTSAQIAELLGGEAPQTKCKTDTDPRERFMF